MTTKTAVAERTAVFGTHNYMLGVHYRGRLLRWSVGSPPITAYANFLYLGVESEEHARNIARKRGFTHIRFTGDWTKRTKPKGGKL